MSLKLPTAVHRGAHPGLGNGKSPGASAGLRASHCCAIGPRLLLLRPSHLGGRPALGRRREAIIHREEIYTQLQVSQTFLHVVSGKELSLKDIRLHSSQEEDFGLDPRLHKHKRRLPAIRPSSTTRSWGRSCEESTESLTSKSVWFLDADAVPIHIGSHLLGPLPAETTVEGATLYVSVKDLARIIA